MKNPQEDYERLEEYLSKQGYSSLGASTKPNELGNHFRIHNRKIGPYVLTVVVDLPSFGTSTMPGTVKGDVRWQLTAACQPELPTLAPDGTATTFVARILIPHKEAGKTYELAEFDAAQKRLEDYIRTSFIPEITKKFDMPRL